MDRNLIADEFLGTSGAIDSLAGLPVSIIGLFSYSFSSFDFPPVHSALCLAITLGANSWATLPFPSKTDGEEHQWVVARVLGYDFCLVNSSLSDGR